MGLGPNGRAAGAHGNGWTFDTSSGGADTAATALARIDQRHNGAGKQRIVVSSSVKAPS